MTFSDFNLTKFLQRSLDELGLTNPTPIQEQSFQVIRSGKDVVGIAQTGTGKTLAYLLPLLHDHKYSEKVHPKVLILVPTRELVVQMVERIDSFAQYLSVRTVGVYGGTNMNPQKQRLAEGCDIVVATPGRLYDLSLSGALNLKKINKLVIDEVDIMLDLGFRFQLTNIFELLPERRQNILYSATMTEDVANIIEEFFNAPAKITIAVSGTPLDNIAQHVYEVKNFYTKANLLAHLLRDAETFTKVLVFASSKRKVDRLFEALGPEYESQLGVVHSNKSQNYRLRAIEHFNDGKHRILLTTDIMARGLDLDQITHVVSFDTPIYPENYLHRIGRTGRAEQEGSSLLFYTEKEERFKDAIEQLMDYSIPEMPFPEEVEISEELTPEERPRELERHSNLQESEKETLPPGFHEKKEKNKKTNQGGSYRRIIAKKYKKPKTRGDKNFNRRNKNKKKKR